MMELNWGAVQRMKLRILRQTLDDLDYERTVLAICSMNYERDVIESAIKEYQIPASTLCMMLANGKSLTESIGIWNHCNEQGADFYTLWPNLKNKGNMDLLGIVVHESNLKNRGNIDLLGIVAHESNKGGLTP